MAYRVSDCNGDSSAGRIGSIVSVDCEAGDVKFLHGFQAGFGDAGHVDGHIF